MKGHAKLELINKSGKVIQTVEQDNLITNAVPALLAMYASLNKLSDSSSGGSSSSSSAMSPLKNFGGIHVFGDTLNEDKNDFSFPLDKEWLGFGKQSNKTDVINLATYASSESVTKGSEVKFVWDFSPTQCNGTIKALALTSGELNGSVSESPYTKDQLLRQVFCSFATSVKTKLAFADDNGDFYCIDSTRNVFKIHIPYKGSLTFDTATETTFKTLPRQCYSYANGFDGYIYGIIKESSSYNCYRYKISDLSFDEELYVSIATSDITESLSNDNISFAVNNGTILLCTTHNSKSDKSVYTITSTGTVTKEELTGGDIWQYTANNIIIMSNDYYYKMNIATKEMKKISLINSSSSSYYYYCGNKYGVYLYYRFDILSACYYAIGMDNLATICNLETPIEKTSDNSLRITYTLKT